MASLADELLIDAVDAAVLHTFVANTVAVVEAAAVQNVAGATEAVVAAEAVAVIAVVLI